MPLEIPPIYKGPEEEESRMDSIWSGIGTSIAGLFGYKGAKDRNIASAAQAQKQMDFQERMSSTAHQRQMADMRKAGLNPILSAKYGGASSPAGAMAPVYNKARVALENAHSAAQINKLNADTDLVRQKIGIKKPIEDVTDSFADLTQGLNNATKQLWQKFINVGKDKPGDAWLNFIMDKGLFNIVKDKYLWKEWLQLLHENNIKQ